MEGTEAQTPQVEHSQSERWYTPLMRVTSLSKYLAMGLFILLPFVGFWFGVEYGVMIGGDSIHTEGVIVSPMHGTDGAKTFDRVSIHEPTV